MAMDDGCVLSGAGEATIEQCTYSPRKGRSGPGAWPGN
jgi:hypothetical protein